MPSVVAFNGKSIIEPGAYSMIRGGETDPPNQISSGKVLIIDTGSMAGIGGYGSGILGERQQGSNSIYEFKNLNDFRQAVGAGILWDVSKWLFKPIKDDGFKGVDSIIYVSAKESIKAQMTLALTEDSNGGTFVVNTKVEGLCANGVATIDVNVLERGFGLRMFEAQEAGFYYVEFYRGTFRGKDTAGVPYNNLSAANSVPELIVRSPNFNNINALITWANNNKAFNTWFYLDPTTVAVGTGAVVADDYAANENLILAVDGDEDYTDAAFQEVLKYITELDHSFILSDKFATDMGHANNTALLNHIKNDSEFKRILVIGGGNDQAAYAGTIAAAEAYDSELVHLVFSGVQKTNFSSVLGMRTYPSLYLAAAYLGRVAGQEPQVPATFKNLDFDGLTYQLTKAQREELLTKGVMHMRFVDGLGLVINQDINTLQKNEQNIYEDGTSPEGSIMRIALQLNKEISIGIRNTFVGGNANTSSPADVKAYVEGYLKSKAASPNDDNLILSFKNVRTELTGTDMRVEYGFVPNGPVNRFFITGFMYNVSLSA